MLKPEHVAVFVLVTLIVVLLMKDHRVTCRWCGRKTVAGDVACSHCNRMDYHATHE